MKTIRTIVKFLQLAESDCLPEHQRTHRLSRGECSDDPGPSSGWYTATLVKVWLAILFGSLLASPLQAQNVALNKPVTIVAGGSRVISPAPSPNVITDGVFLGETTPYLSAAAVPSAIHWYTPVAGDTVLEIQLGGLFTIDGIIVQADDNDALSVSYLDAGNTYQPLYSVQYASVGFGFRTRPSASQTTWAALTPVSTSAIRITNTSGDGYFGISELQLRGVATVGTDATLIGHWVADDLPLGDSGSWRSRVNSVVAPVDHGSPQVNAGGGFNGHRYVTMNPSHPGDTSTADTFYVPSGSAAHPTGPFTVTAVFRMPVTATGSGSPAGNIWYESAGLVGMEVAGSPNPPDWILGVDGLNHLSVFATRGTSVVNTGRVIIATAVYSEAGVSIYRNGVLEGHTEGAWTTTWSAAPLAFGANRASATRGGSGYPETFFTGDIAEIRIHGAAVDPQREFEALRAIYLPEPRITGFEIVAGTPRISFTTIEAGLYRVEWKNTLTEPAWTAVTGGGSISGNGGIVEVADSGAASGNLTRRFYRVLLLH